MTEGKLNRNRTPATYWDSERKVQPRHLGDLTRLRQKRKLNQESSNSLFGTRRERSDQRVETACSEPEEEARTRQFQQAPLKQKRKLNQDISNSLLGIRKGRTEKTAGAAYLDSEGEPQTRERSNSLIGIKSGSSAKTLGTIYLFFLRLN